MAYTAVTPLTFACLDDFGVFRIYCYIVRRVLEQQCTAPNSYWLQVTLEPADRKFLGYSNTYNDPKLLACLNKADGKLWSWSFTAAGSAVGVYLFDRRPYLPPTVFDAF